MEQIEKVCNSIHIPTPSYIIDKEKLFRNLNVLDQLKKKSQCSILLALKGYATYATFPLLNNILDGVTASSIYEARLGKEEFKTSIHGYSLGLTQSETIQMNQLCSHISFNSINQLNLFNKSNKTIHPSLGIRINPEVSTVTNTMYDPCAKYSRLGIPLSTLPSETLTAIEGLHFHALCEQNTDALEQVLVAIEKKLGTYLHHIKWMNWGGGHHITRSDYNVDHLVDLIRHWKTTYNLDIILEPGEAIALNSGYYAAKVLDIITNENNIAILDISATAHMPDILEYPYRPTIINAGNQDEYPHQYILGGNTCLAGDVIGTYTFKTPLEIDDTLIFTDMGHYTIVKTSNFNGIKQPSIGIIDEQGNFEIIKHSNYFNFKERLS